MSGLVVLIPSLLSTPTRANFANLLLRSIADQVEHADAYVLCIRGPYTDKLRVPESLKDLLTVVKATDTETSQLLQLRRAWQVFSAQNKSTSQLWVSFSDDDDLWSPIRIKTLRESTNFCNSAVTAIRELQYATGASSSGDFPTAPKSSEVVQMPPRGTSEYYLCTMRACVVDDFFTKASKPLLRHPYADQAFVRFATMYRGSQGQTAYHPLKREGPLYYYRIHSDSVCQRVKDEAGGNPKNAIRNNIHCMVLSGVVCPRLIASYLKYDPVFFSRVLKALKKEVGTSVIDSRVFDTSFYYTLKGN